MAPSSRTPRILTARPRQHPAHRTRLPTPGPGAGRQPSHSGQRTQPHRTVHRASPEIRRLELAERQGRPKRITPACRRARDRRGIGPVRGTWPYLGDIEYPLSEEGSKQRHTKDRSADTKHIQFWMATPISAIDNLRRTHAFGPVHRADIGEIDEVLWLTPAEAARSSAIPPIRTSSRYSLIGCRRARLTPCR